MRLSPRLMAIAEMVGCAYCVADIGTDHGYVPVYLVRSGKAECAIAADISRGSLAKAKELVSRYGLEDKIMIRLGDGLTVLKPGEADVVILAGIGGALTAGLLETGRGILDSVDRVILQPMNAQELVRQWLPKSGFAISDERLVKEKGRIYQVIMAVHGNGATAVDDPFYFEVGRKLIENKDPLLYEFAMRKISELQGIEAGLSASTAQDSIVKLDECRHRIKRYREVVELCR
jgi:tRNA (adenine22-N1)-methyltransferase